MSTKRVMGKGKRAVLLFLAVLMSAVAAGCAAAVFANSFITVEGADGTASYFVSPLAQKTLLRSRRFLTTSFPEMSGM